MVQYNMTLKREQAGQNSRFVMNKSENVMNCMELKPRPPAPELLPECGSGHPCLRLPANFICNNN
jgi:hypothetical protein